MTDPADGQPRSFLESDIIDAEYIVLPRDVAPLAQPTAESPGLASASSIHQPTLPVGGMDMLRNTEPGSLPRKAARGGPVFWAVGIGMAAAAFWMSGGHELARVSPFIGPFIGSEAQPMALRIAGVTSRVDETGARPVLFVDGEAANDSRGVEHLPALEIAVTGKDGRVTRYRLGTSGRPMAPGERYAFSSRLDVPKNGVKTVSVAFAR